MPLIKRARPELRAIYGDEFFEYTFDINSTGKDLIIMFIPYKLYVITLVNLEQEKPFLKRFIFEILILQMI